MKSRVRWFRWREDIIERLRKFGPTAVDGNICVTKFQTGFFDVFHNCDGTTLRVDVIRVVHMIRRNKIIIRSFALAGKHFEDDDTETLLKIGTSYPNGLSIRVARRDFIDWFNDNTMSVMNLVFGCHVLKKKFIMK